MLSTASTWGWVVDVPVHNIEWVDVWTIGVSTRVGSEPAKKARITRNVATGCQCVWAVEKVETDLTCQGLLDRAELVLVSLQKLHERKWSARLLRHQNDNKGIRTALCSASC